jgi:hypothetical protein
VEGNVAPRAASECAAKTRVNRTVIRVFTACRSNAGVGPQADQPLLPGGQVTLG